LGLGQWSCGCATQPATTQASPSPISYRHEIRTDPKLHLHIVTIDLSDPRIELVAVAGGDDPDGAGPWQTTLQTVREMARRDDLDVAVNANFFSSRQAVPVRGKRVPYFAGNWARPSGWLMCGGNLISERPGTTSLVIDRDGKVRIGHFDTLPQDAVHVVSGSEQVLAGGRITTSGKTRVPRTGAGIDATGTKLILLVADGRRPGYSVGLSETELAQEMQRLGCVDVLNLDGGGSSTLVMRTPGENGTWRVMNRPSDGHDLAIPLSVERTVACALGARVHQEKRP
jgi:hypothetical protein